MATNIAIAPRFDLDGSAPETLDVAVIGAGPVGLTLATLLTAYGLRTVVFDRATGPARYSRAAVIHARTLETLHPLGVADEMLAHGVIVRNFGIHDRDRRLLAVPFEQLSTPYPFTLMLPQDQSETILRAALERRGGQIRWGYELTAIEQDDDGATLILSADGASMRVRARYVVGCDGAHSAVRALTGIPFRGERYAQSFVLADVDMDWPLTRDEVQLFFSPEGLVVVAPLPGERRYRIVATVDDAPSEPTLADVQALLDARGPRQIRPQIDTVIWSSRFRVHHRLAERFRVGAAFLCGDAAHVHSPAGGQGMNTGIQDAANLAWKLALVLNGEAGDALLDSYEQERRAVAQQVLSTTHRLTQVATMRSQAMRAVRNVLIGAADRLGPLPRRLAGNLAQLDIEYRAGWRVDPAATVEHLLPDGRNGVGNLTPGLRLLVPEAFVARASTAARRSSAPVRVETRPGLDETLLVRADGYMAGRGPAGDHERLLGLLGPALGAGAQSAQRSPIKR